jgi:hypothetical protein
VGRDLGARTPRYPGVPRILAKHDGNPHRARPEEIDADRSEYASTRVILMIRDLRDAAISNYFQVTRREASFEGDLRAWLRAPRGSVASMLRYYSVWAAQRHVPRGFLLLRYEDLREDTARELRRVCDFVGLPSVMDAGRSPMRSSSPVSSRCANAKAARPADGTPLAAGAAWRPGFVQDSPGQGSGVMPNT